MPRISVIMPLYNAERFVSKAILSILNQTYEDFELIMVDDCSTDSTMSIVDDISDSRIKILHNCNNMGIAYSRNLALANCMGEYIAIMDDDDLSIKDRFKLQVDFLDSNENIDAVGGRICFIDEDDNYITPFKEAYYNPKYMKAELLFRNPTINSSMMFKKSVIEENEIKYRDGYLGLEDYMFWVEFSKVGNICELNDVLAKYRVYQENESNRNTKDCSDERARVYSNIQKYSLSKDGFELSYDELNLFTRVFDEYRYRLKNEKEMYDVVSLLNKVIDQAYNMNLDNKCEIVSACKNNFALKIKSANYLWSR